MFVQRRGAAMPSSTQNRPRTRAKPSDWVVLVPGQQPADQSDSTTLGAPATLTATSPLVRTAIAAPIPRVARPTSRPTLLPSAIQRLLPSIGMVGVFVALLGLILGRNPLLTLGIVSPQFVAYEGTSADGVRFVLDDGWSQTAAVPGGLLMDWSEGRSQPAMRLAFANPAAEPEVSQRTADGKAISEIRYASAWPGVDAEFKAQPGGFSGNFIVSPGVDPSVVELEYVGATELTIDPTGRLRIRGADGVWIDGLPESWQDGPNGREPVESHYELRGGNRFGFSVGAFDPSRPLTVDPPSEKAN
jgi:hypothetical protein